MNRNASGAAASEAVDELERIRIEYARRNQEIPADRYSWVHPVNRYTHTEIWRAAIDCLNSSGLYPLRNRSILDVGCGRGTWLMEFLQWGALPEHIFGIDVLPDRISDARRSLPTSDLRVGDAGQMPWEANTFDVVTQFCVFTSVLDESLRQRMAEDMVRVLKPQGAILWYDFVFDNPSNANVRGIKETEVHSLFKGCQVSLRRITLAPPIARAIVPVSWIAAHCLGKLPFLRTHVIGIIRKKS